VALRQGRWADATSVVDDLQERPLPVRERLLVAGLDAALVHRRGDQAAMERSLESALQLVRRHPVDLTSLMAHAEVALLCARLGMPRRARSLLGQLAGATATVRPGQPFHSVVAAGTALAGLLLEDAELACDGAAALRPSVVPALAAAGTVIEDIARGQVPGDAPEVAWSLVETGLVLEAAIVAGQAALNATTGEQAAPLLKAAREIRARLPRRGADEAVGVGALSEREREIAALVVDGHTYKDIGATLFISAKTVEHHVAHIRTKLGVATRAEMLSTLRAGLPA